MANSAKAALTALIVVTHEHAGPDAKPLVPGEVARHLRTYQATVKSGDITDDLQALVARVIRDADGRADCERYATWQHAGTLFRKGLAAARAEHGEDRGESYRRQANAAKQTMCALLAFLEDDSL